MIKKIICCDKNSKNFYILITKKKIKNKKKPNKFLKGKTQNSLLTSFFVILFMILIFSIISFILRIFIFHNNNFFQHNNLKNFMHNNSKIFQHNNSKINFQNNEKEYKKFLNIFPKLSNGEISNLTTIFQSRELLINDSNITNEYIHFIRPINEEEEINCSIKKYENITPYEFWNSSRPNQYNKIEYYNLCNEEKLINFQNLEYSNEPLISIIVKSYNKGDIIIKSMRSIQNQSIKNIEIIIVDDGSTDNSKEIYKKLLESDPRIRIFYHLNNMGIWRTCLDGFLYSKSKYFIYFDMEDFYTDNYVLEDVYDIIERYQLDSVRFSFFKVSEMKNPYSNIKSEMKYNKEFTKIIYGTREFDVTTFEYGTVWNRLIRANIFTKGLYLLDHYLLNVYKNLWEDRWISILVNKISYSYLMINRPGYLYFLKKNGEGKLTFGDNNKKFKIIIEFINFWIFDLKLLPKKDNKKSVVDSLRQFFSDNNKYNGIIVNLDHINKKCIPYEILLNSLIEDPFLQKEDKLFVNNIYKGYKRIFHSNN